MFEKICQDHSNFFLKQFLQRGSVQTAFQIVTFFKAEREKRKQEKIESKEMREGSKSALFIIYLSNSFNIWFLTAHK